jgi:hypothetical protein
MEAGRRRGRGRMPRPRTRTPANPRNRAGPREDDTTIALLRKQQEIMAQMVEQQQRTNRVIELLATRLVQVPAVRAPTPPPSEDLPPSPATPGHDMPEPPVDLVVLPPTPGSPARSRRLASQWPPAQSNSWKNMSGTPRRPKYLRRRSCRRQSDVSAKQRPDGRSFTREVTKLSRISWSRSPSCAR